MLTSENYEYNSKTHTEQQIYNEAYYASIL